MKRWITSVLETGGGGRAGEMMGGRLHCEVQ